MDLAKFISLLSNRSLYFTSFEKFNDPYEFYLPQIYTKSLNIMREEDTKKMFEDAKRMIKKIENIDQEKYLISIKNINNIFNDYILKQKNIEKEAKAMFGVSCWHINEYENEALWKIYTNQGQGIAIETNVEKLEQSLDYHIKMTFDKVRYENFDTNNLQKNNKHYWGFIKRKAFEYEKEYRAIALLDEKYFGRGCYIKTDLNVLIEKIHISPFMPKYFLDSIKYLCQGELSFLGDRIVQSKLYDEYTNPSSIKFQ